MSVIVKTDKAKWINAINNASDRAAYALAEQMLADSEQYVPKLTDDLREHSNVVKDDNGKYYLIYDSVYALYQWFGVRADGTHRVNNYTTAGTGRQWVDTAKEKNADKWRDIAQKAFTGALK